MVRKDVQVAREGGGERRLAREDVEALVEERVNRRAAPARLGRELRPARVREDDVIDERTGGRLPALGEPHSGHHRREVRPPDARDEPRLARDRHVAARRPADEREARLERLRRDRAAVQRRTQRPDPTCVRVDDRDGDGRPGSEPQLARAPRRQHAGTLAHRPHRLADAGEAVRREIAEADAIEVVALPPAPVVPEVRPLADGRAERSDVDARGAVDEKVRQVEEARRAAPGLGQVLLQPEELRRLHLGRDDPADVAQDLVAGLVDAGGQATSRGGPSTR